jgi:cytochrome P450
VDGRRLDEVDFGLFFLLLVDAGDPGLLPAAIEEMLRWSSPVIYMRRPATSDTEPAG